MTALSQYSRLETLGKWTPAQGEAAREVVVAFGDATIILSDGAGQPITHWSLPAVIRLNPGVMPALFTPDPEGTETLEIDDDWVINAIEKIQRAVTRSDQGRKPIRRIVLGLALAALAAGLVFGPNVLRNQASQLVPFSKQAEIGATVLGQIQVANTASCRDPFGVQALAKLQERILGPDWRGHIVVMPQGVKGVQILPGQTVLVARDVLTSAAEPAVLAGAILTAVSAPENAAPMTRLLEDLPFTATVNLLTQGDIPFEHIRDAAPDLATRPSSVASEATLRAAFKAAEVPLQPWADQQKRADLAAADPYAGETPPMVLSDNDWVGLLGICS